MVYRKFGEERKVVGWRVRWRAVKETAGASKVSEEVIDQKSDFCRV